MGSRAWSTCEFQLLTSCFTLLWQVPGCLLGSLLFKLQFFISV
jgi:hypothetical protein